jgi:CRP-like cAMP-binding protein
LKRNGDTAIRVRSTYERTLAPGDTVFDEGDPGDHLYVIQSGEIELAREGSEGRRVVARLGPGDFFGELAVVAGQRRSTRAAAVKQTRVLELDRATLEAMCLAQPEIAIRMIRILVSRLVEPAGENGGLGFRVSSTLRQLAERAGLSMLEAHRALHQLFDRKLLHLVEDRLEVPDLEALAGCLDRPE